MAAFLDVDFLRELCIALAIVGTATVSIERMRVKSFSAELSGNVASKLAEIEDTTRDAIMRGPLPRTYYEDVKQLMLMNRFLRVVSVKWWKSSARPSAGILV